MGAWTNPGGSRTGFGALLVGLRQGDNLRYAGRVGTGFSQKTVDMLMTRLAPLVTKEMPFTEKPVLSDRWGGNSKPTMHWVRPELVVEVAYTTITDAGILRQASFQGVREDKPARLVTGDKPAMASTRNRLHLSP